MCFLHVFTLVTSHQASLNERWTWGFLHSNTGAGCTHVGEMGAHESAQVWTGKHRELNPCHWNTIMCIHQPHTNLHLDQLCWPPKAFMDLVHVTHCFIVWAVTTCPRQQHQMPNRIFSLSLCLCLSISWYGNTRRLTHLSCPAAKWLIHGNVTNSNRCPWWSVIKGLFASLRSGKIITYIHRYYARVKLRHICYIIYTSSMLDGMLGLKN